MIVAVLSALGMVFYVGFWLITTGYVAWAGNAQRFGMTLMFAGFVCFVAGILLGLRVLAALLGWI